mmetsp:Transcript_33805/g.100832  ORF Transcript_33805/g.100832 Transcript_33805/m.100832 type:complete len:137 (-) Transcript_33805:3107-3517(-)
MMIDFTERPLGLRTSVRYLIPPESDAMLKGLKETASSLALSALDEKIRSLETRERSLRKERERQHQRRCGGPPGETGEPSSGGRGDWTESYKKYDERWEDDDDLDLELELMSIGEKIEVLKKMEREEGRAPAVSVC